MGQYYKPTILTKSNAIKAWWYSHEFQSVCKFDHGTFLMGSGLKLMEHSWRKNNFVFQVMKYLENNPQRLVWAGDYAEPEKNRKRNVYSRCTDAKKIAPIGKLTKVGGDEGIVVPNADLKLKFILNHSKKQFVNLDSVPKDNDGWQIHSLPLLTCEGNGQGGGDFWGWSQNLVGTWARDTISSCRKVSDIPEGFTELKPDFAEKR